MMVVFVKYIPKIDESKCIGDGACKKVCPVKPNVFEIWKNPVDGRLRAYVLHPEACNGCYACVRACPQQAITITIER